MNRPDPKAPFAAAKALIREAAEIALVGNVAGVERRVPLPAGLGDLLAKALDELARGRVPEVAGVPRELATQRAADRLGVSRPFLIGLLEEGRIPHRKVGAHRRIALTDLDTYKRAWDAERARALDELTRLSQELGLDY